MIRTARSRIRSGRSSWPSDSSRECDETGGWSHRNLYGAIGWAGEYLTHLAIPEICLHGGIGLLTTPMDGNTPQGEAEIKTATACAHTNGETRWAFTVRPSQRRDHALPLICVGMGADFVAAFSGRRLVLPACAAQVAALIDAVFVIPLGAYSSPERTFIISESPSQEPLIRAHPGLFRVHLPTARHARTRWPVPDPRDPRPAGEGGRALRFVEALGHSAERS